MKLHKGPKIFVSLTVLAIDQDELLIVIVVRCVVLNGFPENIGEPIRVYGAVKDNVCITVSRLPSDSLVPETYNRLTNLKG